MGTISDKTIKQLQAAVETKIINVDGDEFVTRPIFRAPQLKQNEPSPILIATLAGLADYVRSRGLDCGDDELRIHVASHKEVNLVGGLYGDFDQRDAYVSARFEELFGKSFSFGQYYDHESFVVGLQCLFEQTEQRDKVLQVIGTIKESEVLEHSDDGVKQNVTAKAGIALVTEVAVPNPVELKPFRTFREIDQPVSLFVLRVKSVADEMPQCALFEADGGAWKLTAINAIAYFLKEQGLNLPIIA